jgi:outer membrane protein assembly factor BamB
MFRILCSAFVFLAAPALAQTVTWRIPNYADSPAGAGLLQQSIALDSSNDVYVMQPFYDVVTPSVRIEKFSRAAGVVVWTSDFPATQSTYFTTVKSTPAAIASVGDDVLLSVTNLSSFEQGSVRRLRGADGSVLWQASEAAAGDIYYDAVAADVDGNAIISGARSIGGAPLVAHAAKFAGSDGSLQWSFDDVADSCGTQAIIHAQSVAADAHGDVVLLEQATQTQTPAYVFCVVKLDGASGHKLWAKPFVAADGIAITPIPPANLRLDSNGNPAVSAAYISASNESRYAVVARFNAADGSLAWKHDWLNAPDESAGHLAFDAAGDVIHALGSTQLYAAADGAAKWATPSAVAGPLAVTIDGTIVVATSDTTSYSSAQMHFAGLDPASGAARWTSALTLPTWGYWINDNLVVADSSGAFVAVQEGSAQTTILRAEGTNGNNDWTVRDYVVADGYAYSEPPFAGSDRLTARTPDGDIVVAGVAARMPGNIGRWVVVKRSTLDGHAMWTALGDAAHTDCSPQSVAVDPQGDSIVGVLCSNLPSVTKIAGDGRVLWTSASLTQCPAAFSQSVSADTAGDVYATYACTNSTGELEVTVKHRGSDGAIGWTHSSPDSYAYGPYTSFVRADGANGIVVADATQSDTLVRKLRADTGAIVWSQELTEMFRLSALRLFSNNDPFVIGGNSDVVRLNTTNGQIRWSTPDNDLDIVGAMIDAAGNAYTIGDYVQKFDGGTGAKRWSNQLPAEVDDIATAADGSIVMTGFGYVTAPGAYVATLESNTGAVRWSLVDSSADMTQIGVGVVTAPDGGVVVAESTAAAWILARVSGKFAEDVFAGGFEP